MALHYCGSLKEDLKHTSLIWYTMLSYIQMWNYSTLKGSCMASVVIAIS